ncbi:MAG: tetratricopeptide repeat protein [Archangium sp.]|nr:tetratricopeptide repeat protein [Archangium sp.]
MNIQPLLVEAERYLTLKDVDRAAELYVHAQQQCAGRSPMPLVGLARIAILMQKFDEAGQLLSAVNNVFPACAEALTLLGVLEEAAGRLDEAIVFHTRALAHDSALAVAHVNLGRSYALLDRWELSAASYTLAIQHGALDVAVKVQLGTALFRAHRTPEALKVLSLTVQAHPKHLDAILTLADALVETGALQLAAELLDNAAPRLPEEALIASRRASIALRMKDLEAARREAWRHTLIAPKDEEAWLFAAVIDTMLLRFDSAEKALKQILRINPKNARAHYHLGGLFDALKDKAAAKKSYRAAISCDSQAWEPLNNLAIMLLEEGTPASLTEARTLLDRAIRLGTRGDAILIRYNLALACYRLGDLLGTRRAAQELLKLAPVDHPMATEAHRVLKLAA